MQGLKTIAVEIDDVLNNLADKMNEMGIIYNSWLHSLNDPLLKKCLYDIKTGTLTPIAKRVMSSTMAREEGVSFLRWLHKSDWTILLITYRDLRFAYDITVEWLRQNEIPYDYLFYVDDCPTFCRDMHIKYSIGVKPYPFDKLLIISRASSDKHDFGNGIHKFHAFEEVKQWLQNELFLTSSTQQSIGSK